MLNFYRKAHAHVYPQWKSSIMACKNLIYKYRQWRGNRYLVLLLLLCKKKPQRLNCSHYCVQVCLPARCRTTDSVESTTQPPRVTGKVSPVNLLCLTSARRRLMIPGESSHSVRAHKEKHIHPTWGFLYCGRSELWVKVQNVRVAFLVLVAFGLNSCTAPAEWTFNLPLCCSAGG